MDKNIKKDDIAVIKWDNVPEQHDIIILHMPQGEGDLIRIEYMNGTVQAFSPMRPDFIIEKKP